MTYDVENPALESDLNIYQAKAISTAIYPSRGSLWGMIYCTLKLNGEAGEVAEKIGKILRDNNGKISDEKRIDLIKELGDVLWYIANLANELSVTLDDVAQINLDKLAQRKANNTLHGSGDNR